MQSNTPQESIDWLNANDLCNASMINTDILIQIVEYGIIEPTGSSLSTWQFTPSSVAITCKALRLYHDLELDWAATAIAVGLLEQLEEERRKNQYLEARLARLLGES